MGDNLQEYYFYPGDSAQKNAQLDESTITVKQTEEKVCSQDYKPRQEQTGKKDNEVISLFGLKISYAKAFGITFLIIFLLLFFPGIGVSSSSVNSKVNTTDKEKGDPKENSKT
jgi:hypothetical protein